MHMLDDLKDMLCDELEEYGSKGKLDVGDLEIVDKLAHAIKNIDKIIMAKEYGLSYDGETSTRDNRPYRRDGGRDQRYSRDSYSRRRGRYSGADTKELVEDLREVMDHADGTMKHEFEQFIRKIEKM